jgi:hypothetical protein
MSDDHELRPLGDDEAADPRLRAMFRAARDDLPPVDVAAVARGASGGGGAGGGGSDNAWVSGAGAVLAVVLAVVLGATGHEEAVAPAPAATPVPAPAPEAPRRTPEPAETTPVAAAAPVLAAPAPAPEPRAEPPRRAGPPRRPAEPASPPEPEPPVAPAEDTALAEGTVLLRARSALARGDAAAALSAVREHADRFPDGRLAIEREALAIDALLLAGRRDEARARATRLVSQAPDSPYASRARRALVP